MSEKNEKPPSVGFLVEVEALVNIEQIHRNIICWFCKKESSEEEGRPITGYIYNPLGYGYTYYYCQQCLTEILVNTIKIKTEEDKS